MKESKRGRAKGRRPGYRRFALVPEEVLESPAVTTLNHAAFRVLVIVACGCWEEGEGRKGNNGTQALTESYAKKYGFSGRDTVYRSLRELVERGLLVQTRQGTKSKKHFNLYGVGWLRIYSRNGWPLDKPEPAPNDWINWRPSVPIVGNEETGIHTDGRGSSVPVVGKVEANSSHFHTDGRYTKADLGTDGREHSKNLGAVGVESTLAVGS